MTFLRFRLWTNTEKEVAVMSVYAMSDLHGCYERYIKMLDEINLCDDDTLYILGDVVDRGDGGIKILQDS